MEMTIKNGFSEIGNDELMSVDGGALLLFTVVVGTMKFKVYAETAVAAIGAVYLAGLAIGEAWAYAE